MENFYEVMLESVCKFQGFESIESSKFHKYLNQLQESLKELRGAYQNNTVSVDYTSSNIQMAYLLGYYPHYVGMTLKILKDIHEIFNNHDSLNNLIERKIFNHEESLQVCFFAAGPAPESVALCQYINDNLLDNFPEILGKKLYLNTFDLDYDKWAVSRSMTRERVLPIIIDGKYDFALEPHRVDLLQPNCLEEHQDIIEDSHLFFLQNCLNELAKQKSQFLENFQYLLNHAPSDSLIIIADLCQYDVVTQLMNSIENLSKEKKWLIIRSDQSGKQQLAQYSKLPEILTTHLLTGESNLIPKKWTKYNFSVFYKPEDYIGKLTLLANYINEIENQGYVFSIKNDILQKIENFDIGKEGLAREWQKLAEFEFNKTNDKFSLFAKELTNLSKHLIEEKQYNQAIILCTYLFIFTKNIKYFDKLEIIRDIIVFLHDIEQADQIAIIANFISKLTDIHKSDEDSEKKANFTIDDLKRGSLIRKKAKNLYEIVKNFATCNQYDDALNIAKIMHDSNIIYADFQAKSLCIIVENLAKIKKYDTAIEIASTISTFSDFYSDENLCIKINALEKIVYGLIQDKEYEKALDVIENSEDYYKEHRFYDVELDEYNWKDVFFAMIAEKLAEINQYQKAFDITNKIEEIKRKCESFIGVSSSLIKTNNYEQAIKASNYALIIAKNIDIALPQYDVYYRDIYLDHIAICLLEAREYDQSILVANSINFNRENTFWSIAENLSQSNKYGQALLICRQYFGNGYFDIQLNILYMIVENLVNDEQYTQVLTILELIKEKLNEIHTYNSCLAVDSEIINFAIDFLSDIVLWGKNDRIKPSSIDDFMRQYNSTFISCNIA